jgi:hypothetical protein
MNNQEAEDLAANKRAALAGQWRTPPIPVYPTGYRAPPSVPTAPPPAPVPETELPNPTSIPANSDEYAKALQEAYRKGAEAAARMAQQQQQQQQQQLPLQHIPTAASCPDFSAPENRPAAYPMHSTHTSMTDTSMPPPPPQHPHTYASTPQPHTLATTSSQPHTHYSPLPPPPPAAAATAGHHAPLLQYTSVAAPAPTASTASSNAPQQGRSISMPDMASYAVQAEEEKRQKRLARNRQSARLRRQRKKNLVRNIKGIVHSNSIHSACRSPNDVSRWPG